MLACANNKNTVGHKRCFALSCCFAVLTILLQTTPAFTQVTEEDRELLSFQQRIEAARAAAMDNTSPPQEEEYPENDAATQYRDLASQVLAPDTNTGMPPKTIQPPLPPSPLGPAANLPFKPGPAASGLDIGGLAPMPSPSAEQLQKQMELEAAQEKARLDKQLFDMAIQQLMPLTPEQIRATYEEFIINREASETPIRIPEKNKRVETISLDPSSISPSIHLVPGYVTTVSILDTTGSPWPIQDLSYAGSFQITPPESGGHIIRMSPLTAHGVGNMSVRLVDLITPVVFTLESSITDVDYRLDIRIPKPGPLAKVPLIEYGGLTTVAGNDSNLSAMLDGTPPNGAEKLALRGVDGRSSAWRLGGKIYLRTPLTLLSPAWDSSVTSADGTVVYTINDTPVILLSDNGKMYSAQIADNINEVSP